MKTNKIIFQDKPADGHALLSRTTESFRRTANGAWIAGGSTTETFEIPLATLNSSFGASWLNPGRCGHLTVALPDGSYFTVCGVNDPLSVSVDSKSGVLKKDGQEIFARPLHPLLPNLFVEYYRINYHTNKIIASFEAFAAYLITYRNAEGDIVETTKTGPLGVTRDFAEHVAKTGLIVRPQAVSYTVEPIS